MRRLRPSLLFLCCAILHQIGFAQISPRLQSVLSEQPNDLHRVRVEFKDNVDCYALNHTFKQQRLAVDLRARTVIGELQQQAEVSQSELVAFLRTEHAPHIRALKQFWVVNLLVLEANREAIQAIAAFPNVALIDLENNRIVPHDPIIRGEVQHQRSPNGIEPGLAAINAPAMWALGYTGRGRMVYDYDTGVWPTHPAFADRFMAHRFPMEQCWFGFFSNIPNGNISDHGTHTLGTMAGLVEETNDTIGVAFKSYWIANDYVTSTVEALPPLTDMIAAFEWALNPDGDINTTEDIPDVINNSWRWRDDPDTVQCGGFVVNLMNAIEAAGIANVFSGGNSGPGNSTVNAPQRINTSEVNTFSVGSVDGNQAFPYPISNFSTRGPSQCPSGGNLSREIHPEVVAPGQNVRSAWGTDDFNTISGTSMAAPHVSGAILLLKEAFPYLSGEDLLWALYETAVDLGDTGEDNVYGMGIIDVHAAYLQLAQTNTPIDPNDVPWDLAIVSATNPAENGFTCEGAFATTVTFTNLGDNTITSINFEYDINGIGTQNQSWTGNLTSGQTETINLPSISTAEYGDLGLNILATITGQPTEYDLINNRWRINFNRRQPRTLPFTDDFDHGFSLNDWFVQNEDGGIGWDTLATGGLSWNSYSATVQCYSYNPRSSQRDGLVSPQLEIPATTDPVWLIFDVAYQKRTVNGIGHDTLLVQVSTDCGESFPDEVYRKAADELGTNDTTQLNFVPEFAWDWRRDSVSLSAYVDSDILLRFETINRKGNNIFIDNLKVFTGQWEPASIADLASEVKLYPNPTAGILYLELEEMNMVRSLVLRNMLGEDVPTSFSMSGNRATIDTEKLEAGMYFIELTIGPDRVAKRFVKH